MIPSNVSIDLRSAHGSIYLPYANNKLTQLTKRRIKRNKKVLHQRVYVDDGTEIYIISSNVKSSIRISDAAVVLVLYNPLEDRQAFFMVTASFNMNPVFRIMEIEEIGASKKGLYLDGNKDKLQTDSDTTLGNIWYQLNIGYQTYDFLPFPSFDGLGHDGKVPDDILFYGNTSFIRVWFPQVNDNLYYSSRSGSNVVYRPYQIGESKNEFFVNEENTFQTYDISKDQEVCYGRHNFTVDDDRLLVDYNIHVTGRIRKMQDRNRYEFSWYETVAGNGVRDWSLKYTDERGERGYVILSDSSDDNNATLHVPMAVISITEVIHSKDMASKNQTERTELGRVFRNYTIPGEVLYCCGWAFGSGTILYRDDQGNGVCQTQNFLRPGQSWADFKTLLNKVTTLIDKSLKVGPYVIESRALTRVRQDNNCRTALGFVANTTGGPPVAEGMSCPVSSYPRRIDLEYDLDSQTWTNTGHEGGLLQSDHISDPIADFVIIDREIIDTHEGCWNMAVTSYDNHNSDYFCGIIRVTNVESEDNITELSYFNTGASREEINNYLTLKRRDVNGNVDSVEWQGISSWPLTNFAFQAPSFLANRTTPKITEYDVYDKKTYTYFIYLKIQGSEYKLPISVTGNDTYEFKHRVVNTSNPGLLSPVAGRGPVYPEQVFHFETSATYTINGERILGVSIYLDKPNGLATYTYTVEKQSQSLDSWEFKERVIGLVSLRYFDDNEQPFHKTYSINENNTELLGDLYADFPYDELCSVAIKS